MRVAADPDTSEEHRSRRRRSDRGDGSRDDTVADRRRHDDARRDEPGRVRGRLPERRGRRVRAEIGDREPATPHDVGDERGGEPVEVAGRRAEHHDPARPPPADEQRPEPSDQPVHHRAGAVFLGDGDPARRPVVADAPQRGTEHVEVELFRCARRGEQVLHGRATPRSRPRARGARSGAVRRGDGAERHRSEYARGPEAARSGRDSIAGRTSGCRPGAQRAGPSARTGTPSCSARRGGRPPPATTLRPCHPAARDSCRPPHTGERLRTRMGSGRRARGRHEGVANANCAALI